MCRTAFHEKREGMYYILQILTTILGFLPNFPDGEMSGNNPTLSDPLVNKLLQEKWKAVKEMQKADDPPNHKLT